MTPTQTQKHSHRDTLLTVHVGHVAGMDCPISRWNWDVSHPAPIVPGNSMNAIVTSVACKVQIILVCIQGMLPAIGPFARKRYRLASMP